VSRNFWEFLTTWGISFLLWVGVLLEIYILWPKIVQIVNSYLIASLHLVHL